MNNFLDIITFLFLVFVDLLKHWPFVFLLIAFIFRKQIKDFLTNINVFKLSQNGIELQKTVKEAKETLTELKDLAFTLYVPLMDILSRIGRGYSSISIEERFKYRKAIEKFIVKNNVDDPRIVDKIKGLNNSILLDVLYSMINNLNGTERVDYYKEISNLFNSEVVNVEFVQCSPDMKTIEQKLIEYELMDESVKYIFDEAKYFIETKDFKNFNELKKHMMLKKGKFD